MNIFCQGKDEMVQSRAHFRFPYFHKPKFLFLRSFIGWPCFKLKNKRCCVCTLRFWLRTVTVIHWMYWKCFSIPRPFRQANRPRRKAWTHLGIPCVGWQSNALLIVTSTDFRSLSCYCTSMILFFRFFCMKMCYIGDLVLKHPGRWGQLFRTLKGLIRTPTPGWWATPQIQENK